jgi:hypothetical protein
VFRSPEPRFGRGSESTASFAVDGMSAVPFQPIVSHRKCCTAPRVRVSLRSLPSTVLLHRDVSTHLRQSPRRQFCCCMQSECCRYAVLSNCLGDHRTLSFRGVTADVFTCPGLGAPPPLPDTLIPRCTRTVARRCAVKPTSLDSHCSHLESRPDLRPTHTVP